MIRVNQAQQLKLKQPVVKDIVMKLKHILSIIAFATAVVPHVASATTTTFDCTGQTVSTLIAANETTDTAHLLYVYSACHASMCGGGQVYIDFSDKAIYAQALMAKAKGLTVNINVEKDTTTPTPLVTKGTAANGYSACRVRALWY